MTALAGLRARLRPLGEGAFAPGQPRPPAVLARGARTQFRLRVVMPTGEGVMRWAPVAGKVLGVWDFVVEND